MNDGKRLLDTKSSRDVRFLQCTRWNELRETVKFHAQLAALLEAPTKFTLLNDPGRRIPTEFTIAQEGIHAASSSLETQLANLERSLYDVNPSGCTPLTQKLYYLYKHIAELGPLLVEGKKVSVILATDGVPTDTNGMAGPQVDEEFRNALRQLQTLEVWIVIRLCTDDAHIIQYYQKLDDELELNLEVLDDFEAEAKEVFTFNPWMTYGLPLHRLREMGMASHPLLDLMDEAAFGLDQIRSFCQLLLGGIAWPDPHLNLEEFLQYLQKRLAKESKPFHPLKKKPQPWISIPKLRRQFEPRERSLLLHWVVGAGLALQLQWRLIIVVMCGVVALLHYLDWFRHLKARPFCGGALAGMGLLQLSLGEDLEHLGLALLCLGPGLYTLHQAWQKW